jgi:hypothetical protein
MATPEQQATGYPPPGLGATTATAVPVQAATVSSPGEQCPSCGGHLAADQRYCLHCGHRHGEPRLPIMNAVTFMDTMRQPSEGSPPPPPRKRRRFSANTALIAGVATLLLALGVGVMIGRAGNHSVAGAPATPQIVKLSGGGGIEEKTASSGGTVVGGGSKGAAQSKAQKPKPATLKKEAETQSGAEEVLKPSPGVKLPPATVKPGGKCPPGSAGCKHGKFTGNFFE